MDNKVVLDTNIVIILGQYHKDKSIDKLVESNNLSYDKAFAIKILYEKIESGEVDSYITPQIYSEVKQGIQKFGRDTIDYLKNSNIYLFKAYSSKNEYELDEELAKTYIANEVFEIEEKYNCFNDAFIAAFAVNSSLDIITFDNHFYKAASNLKECNEKYKNEYLIPNIRMEDVSPDFNNGIKICGPQKYFKKEVSKLMEEYGLCK